MTIMRSFFHIAFFVSFVILAAGVCNGGKLEFQHKKKCNQAQKIVRRIIWSKVEKDPTLPARLLRLHYHDCFVRGCDASILLDSNGGNATEKEARPNRSVTGYEIIDEVKAKLEQKCPGIVSCADIVALAARDAVSYQFGRSMWPVYMGRKDGKVSLASEADRDLPSAASNFTTLLQLFQRSGLNLIDLVTLSGAHTIGIAHCIVIQRRLYNFTGKGDTDPTLDPAYAEMLKQKCKLPPNLNDTVKMDPNTPLSFDNGYYVALNKNQGLFQSDAALLTNRVSRMFATEFEKSQDAFFERFAHSMVKMGDITGDDGDDGEIRKNCRAIN
ncbi:peroxidase 24 [Senna tora]|uniref:Peroxidase n=1 Tax=Senna tora TaxID=362788 RepID=A0A834X2J5_9FABA|nr:peroxidase 24 [Senna tora]